MTFLKYSVSGGYTHFTLIPTSSILLQIRQNYRVPNGSHALLSPFIPLFPKKINYPKMKMVICRTFITNSRSFITNTTDSVSSFSVQPMRMKCLQLQKAPRKMSYEEQIKIYLQSVFPFTVQLQNLLCISRLGG